MNSRTRLLIPIALKLGGITTALMLGASIWIAAASSEQFREYFSERETNSNQEAAGAKASEVEGTITAYRDKIRTAASLLLREHAESLAKKEAAKGAAEPQAQSDDSAALQLAFQEDRALVNIEIYKLTDGKTELLTRVSQSRFMKEHTLPPHYFQQLRVLRPFPTASVFSRNVEIRNSSIPNGVPLITIGEGLVEDDNGQTTHIAVADVRLDRLQAIFTNQNLRESFLINELPLGGGKKEARVIVHPNDQYVLENKPITSKLIEMALEKPIREGRSQVVNPEDNRPYIANFARTSYGLIVVVQASLDKILEPAEVVKRKAFRITGFTISAAIFFLFIFSITLTGPLERLVAVTRLVASGNFDVRSGVTSHDEVGELAQSFDTMIVGLAERDKMRNVLNKFHGSHVAEDMLKGDLQLGGSNKNVTVFFSDIRDFTKFSEGHSPEEVVTMLNEYFAIMVGIITANHGIVDKFVGDAIMAVWGAPNSSGDDQYYAVKACLEMRKALEVLNEKRLQRGKVEIRIGMGLHTGQAISGTIGSDERMEYTVIGDSVNMAARIEASTKAFGTDLLVSESIMNSTEPKFIWEEAGSAEMKGKAEAQKLFKVRGYITERGPVTVQTKYSDYEAKADDKIKVVA